MLIDRCKKYYDIRNNLNCAECILYAANEEYNMGINPDDLKLAAGFGGGMAVEGTCGALTGAIMVLGRLFVNVKAHESDRIKLLTRELIERSYKKLSTLNCRELKAKYRDEEKRCFVIISAVSGILDDIVMREKR